MVRESKVRFTLPGLATRWWSVLDSSRPRDDQKYSTVLQDQRSYQVKDLRQCYAKSNGDWIGGILHWPHCIVVIAHQIVEQSAFIISLLGIEFFASTSSFEAELTIALVAVAPPAILLLLKGDRIRTASRLGVTRNIGTHDSGTNHQPTAAQQKH